MPVPASAKTLLDFIAKYEAPRGYDTVYANRMSRMPRPITSMTIDELIADGPRRTREFGSSACGRYQFMTATLKGLRGNSLAEGGLKMIPEVQDVLGLELLERRGFRAFMSGGLSTSEFGNRLAMEWASFPVLTPINSKRRGQSYYAGDGQNHALVSPAEVERVLASLKTAPQPVVSPRAAVVPATAVAAPWWSRFLGIGTRSAVAAKARPGLHPNGSADLWDVQAALKDRGYYNTDLLDGLDGGKTQAAVSQARKDNGLGDGGVDAAFITGLPTWPHAGISEGRATLTLGAAEQHAPELFNPAKWLISTGLGAIGVGGASSSGLMDQVQGGVTRANDVFGQVQTAFGLVAGVVGFVVEHKTWFFWGVGLLLVLKGLAFMADGWFKIRRAFF